MESEIQAALDRSWTFGEQAYFAALAKGLADIMAEQIPALGYLSPNEIMLHGISEMTETMQSEVSPEAATDLAYVADTLQDAADTLANLRLMNEV